MRSRDRAVEGVRDAAPPPARHLSSPHGATPRTQLLSNGRYAVMITAAGSGYSRWGDLAITRWREDATRDDTGSYIFLRDVATGARWSAGFQPSGEAPKSYEVVFAEDRAEVVRRDGPIGTRLEVIVSWEDDVQPSSRDCGRPGLRWLALSHGPARRCEVRSRDRAVEGVRDAAPPPARHVSSPHGATPRTQLLSNGRYAVMITAAGSGYSRWRDLAITRWREDATRDDTGSYILLRDVASGARWSAGFQPSREAPESYDVSFAEDRAEIVRRDGTIATRLEVIVSCEDDAEVRRVSLTNDGRRTCTIEVTSYAEIVLAPAAADAAHPAFSNLFIQTESLPERGTLLATRRRRAREDAEVWLAHVLAVEGETIGHLEWETDRGQFLGRGRGVHAPHAETDGEGLSNTVGPVLDPIVSLRRRVRVRPGQTVRLAFSTLVASSRNAVLDLADKYSDVTTFGRIATLASTQAQVQLHHLGIGPDEANLFQALGGSILFADRALRASAEVLARHAAGIAALWAHGISGDLPIVLVEIDEAEAIGIVRQLLRAHAYWRTKRLAVDLVILNDRAPADVQDLQTLLETLARTSQSMPRPEGSKSQGTVFTLRADQVTAAQRDVLESVARVALSSRRGTLAEQVARAHRRADAVPVIAPRLHPAAVTSHLETAGPRPALEFFNGLGGFDGDGREYVTILRAGQWTPAPWVNVIANPHFGCLVSEAGAGCTWSINSQENLPHRLVKRSGERSAQRDVLRPR